MEKCIRIAPRDNVAVALSPVTCGDEILGVAAASDIPLGHKIALERIACGEAIIK